MRHILKKTSWSPYAAGAAIGFISWISIFFLFKAPGVSTTFVRFVGFIVGIFSFDMVLDNDYLANYVSYKPVFEWQFALVIGIFIGAFISARLSGANFSSIPYLWGKNFGFSKKIRYIGAFVGGFLLLFGARLAGGCTMGHGISGGLQLAVSSWIFMFTFFTAGIIATKFLYKNK